MTYNDTARVLQEVLSERARQVGLLGYPEEHDDEKGAAALIEELQWRTQQIRASSAPPSTPRAELVKIASLAVATIETIDRRRGMEALKAELVEHLSKEEEQLARDVFRRIREAKEAQANHEHVPVQHRDGKPPWCRACGLTADGKIPARMTGPEAVRAATRADRGGEAPPSVQGFA